jgi:ATP-dependent exoDNAse (exonuclease V) alpha subunit
MNTVIIPDKMLCSDQNELVGAVYGSMTLSTVVLDANFFRERAILAACNDQIRDLNNIILDQFPGDEQVFDSADTYSIEPASIDDHPNVPLEFLHELNASGLPVAHLRLKNGCPVIILRNIDTKRGLCNGSRATVLRMSHRILQLQLIGGDHDGESVLLPRVTLSPSSTTLDFSIKLKRRQFPVQLAFAMTIHKSQGQSLTHVGIDLRKPIFAHGQLYVALSRATSSNNIRVLLPSAIPSDNVLFPSDISSERASRRSHNVVYEEVLLD